MEAATKMDSPAQQEEGMLAGKQCFSLGPLYIRPAARKFHLFNERVFLPLTQPLLETPSQTEACLLVYFQSNQAGNQNDLSHQFRTVQSLSFYLFENYSSQSSLGCDKILDKCNCRREGLIWVLDLRRDTVRQGRRPSHGSTPGRCSLCVCSQESREEMLALSLSPPIYLVQHSSPERGAAHSGWVFSPQLTLSGNSFPGVPTHLFPRQF